MIAENYLKVDAESFGALLLTSKSAKILKENEKIFLKLSHNPTKGKPSSRSLKGDPYKKEANSFKNDAQRKLFDDLRDFRLKLSKERGSPLTISLLTEL